MEVIQRDLNLETYETILTRAYLEQSLERLAPAWRTGRRSTEALVPPDRSQWALAEGPGLAAQVEAAKAVFRSPAFYDGASRAWRRFWSSRKRSNWLRCPTSRRSSIS